MESQVAPDTDSSEVATNTLLISEPIGLTASSDTVAQETGGFFAGVGHFPPIRPPTPNKTEASQPVMNLTSDQRTCLRCIQNRFFGHAQDVSI